MTVSKSEYDLIGWIRAHPQTYPKGLQKGIGDDCAVFAAQSGRDFAVTTDLLIENVHFRRRTSPAFLGQKALAVNLSDLAAMGARPYGCLLSLGIPVDLPLHFFESLLSGFLKQAKTCACPLIGGDLSRSSRIHISVTALGSVPSGRAVYRHTARAGDRIVVIGDLGLSRNGLQILESEDVEGLERLEDLEGLAQWAREPFRYQCLKAHLLPSPLIESGVWLAEQGLASSMIDVSDGLSSDVLHLARESGLQAFLDWEALHLPQAGTGATIAVQDVISGGEDYALILTVSPAQLSRLRNKYPKALPPFREIGEMNKGEARLFLRQGGETRQLSPEGFDHFR